MTSLEILGRCTIARNVLEIQRWHDMRKVNDGHRVAPNPQDAGVV